VKCPHKILIKKITFFLIIYNLQNSANPSFNKYNDVINTILSHDSYTYINYTIRDIIMIFLTVKYRKIENDVN